MAMPIQWEEIQTEEDLESALLSLESRVKNQENAIKVRRIALNIIRAYRKLIYNLQ